LYFDEKLQDFAQFKIMLSLIAARTPGSRKNSAENEVYSFLIKRYRESYESPSKFLWFLPLSTYYRFVKQIKHQNKVFLAFGNKVMMCL